MKYPDYMKDAFISGASGVAIYTTSNGEYFVIRIDEDCARATETSEIGFQLLHRQLRDDDPNVVYRRDIPQPEIIDILMTEYLHDRVIRLARMSVDPNEDAEFRQATQECFENLLTTDADKAWFAEHDPRK